MDSCPGIPHAAVRRALEVEIGARLEGSPAATGRPSGAPPVGRLIVRCDADHAALAAEKTAGGRLERKLALQDLSGDTGPRVVALAALELLATLDPELRRRLSEADSLLATPDGPPRPRLGLRAGAVYRTFSAPSGIAAWGGQLALDRALGTRLGVAGGIEVSVGRRSTPSGGATALLASGSFAAGWRAGGQRISVRVEGGARGGLVRLSGSAGTPDVETQTVVRPWAGPFGAAHLLLGHRQVCLGLAVEGGLAAVAATGLANDAPALQARGAWIAVSLSAGLQR
jgi:hypothetical protein